MWGVRGRRSVGGKADPVQLILIVALIVLTPTSRKSHCICDCVERSFETLRAFSCERRHSHQRRTHHRVSMV